MAEMMEDEEAAIKREKAEFMYQFEGAMSVIQETEEPEDEITIKNSSSMCLVRDPTVETPRMSKEPMPQRPSHTNSLLSPSHLFLTM